MVKISGLPPDSAPSLTDEIPTRDIETNTTKRTLLSAVRDLIFANVPSTSSVGTGWNDLGVLPYSVSAAGNRSYIALFAADLTSQLSVGQRIRFTNASAAPTKCTSLNGTTQYYSKSSPSGMTFTDDFTVSAWVKLNVYPTGSDYKIATRYNGTSGCSLQIQASGQLLLTGANGGSTNVSYVISYQSLPLNKWVHVAAQLDMSTFTATTTTSYIMMDGVDVPASVARTGTNPTALVQAGNLEIGSWNGGLLPFNGKIAQVAIYSAKVTQATIRNSISQTLVGTEALLISAYTFNNSINDLNTTNANNLTANGSAVATNADSPYAQGVAAGLLEYGIITNISYSGATTMYIQVPEGSALSSTLPIAVSYSPHKVPYGFPIQENKWFIEFWSFLTATTANLSTNTWAVVANQLITIPTGDFRYGFSGFLQESAGSAAGSASVVCLAAAAPTSGNFANSTIAGQYDANAQFSGGYVAGEAAANNASQTVYSAYSAYSQGNATVTNQLRGDISATRLYAIPALL